MSVDIEYVDKSTVSLVKHSGSDLDVALAAWVSNNDNELPADIKSPLWELQKGPNWRTYNNINQDDWKRIEGLINFLYRERHMSPFEHGSFTFRIDTPIFVAREFMRHRTWSYNETSGRYKELKPRFYLVDSERPLTQVGSPGKYSFGAGTDEQYGEVFAQTTLAYQRAWKSYQKMLSLDVAKEVARNVLPVGTMTQFYATANPRNIMQFLLLRNDPNALKEIRDVAVQIETYFAEQMPLTYAAYKKYDYRDEKKELAELRAYKKQNEAYETYAENIEVGSIRRTGVPLTPETVERLSRERERRLKMFDDIVVVND